MSAPAPSAPPWWPDLDLSVSEERVWLLWLVRLRWVAILAQIVVLSFASRLLASPVLILPMVGVSGLLVLGNLRAVQVLHTREEVTPLQILLQLGLDVVSLTTFFLLSGGPENPFTALYLIHVAMAAVMMPARLAAALSALVLACYGIIHFASLPLDLSHHSFGPTVLLAGGRAAAFTITITSVSVFVVGLSSTLRRREAQLLDARDRSSRTDRLRAVGTLAAGAAHELNTPLSTLFLRVRRIARRHTDADTVADLEAVHNQLDRCKQIVDQLLIGAGDPSASEIAHWRAADLVSQSAGWWAKGSGVPMNIEVHDADAVIEVPRVAFTQGLVNLLENAREAQAENSCDLPIQVHVDRDGDHVRVRVRDHGCGLPEDPDRVGDPFFTTKVTGTGLGVFVARAVADGSGGGLRYETGGGRYTEAVWWFPDAVRRSA